MEPAPTAEPTVSLLNDRRGAVELDLGEGWQELEPWQSRQMARGGFAIRLSADRTRIWRIGTDELVAQGQNLRTSKDLGLFSQEMKAEAYREWSEMYLEDVPGGKLQLVNDLDAAVEVDIGRGWRILYPNQKRELSEESFSIRLREDQAVMSTISQGRASGPEYCLRTSEDLEAFSAKASSWVANEQKAVQKEREERQRRKKLSEAKVERRVRKFAVMGFLILLCTGVVLIPLMASIGLWSHACAGLGMALLCFLLYLAAPRTRRCVCIFEAVRRILARCGIATGVAPVVTLHGTEDGEDSDELFANQLRNHPMSYLCFLFLGAFFGTRARSLLPDGQGKVENFDAAGRENLRREAIFARMNEFEESEEYRCTNSGTPGSQKPAKIFLSSSCKLKADL
ncbi:hypothetical protein AK812_SmicGene18651 [Symbiodinium microadriaticum]|uniref:Uncharacterized protein n=1 Tax=Symbiodinium microadriaticum TaxID=2951 RepID=A0A1Q9DUN8_SYMMI|nr:hypothetical protein AK812_SmicGene18651 [Symbiodinium microadriaticum]